MPSSVTDRLTNSWEHVFHFVKSNRYFYDLDSIRQPHKTDAANRLRNKSIEPYNQSYPNGHFSKGERPEGHPLGKNPSDVLKTDERRQVNPMVHHGENSQTFHIDAKKASKLGLPVYHHVEDFWNINTHPFKGAHFAVFPEKLVEPMIKSSCPKDGVVLDPFCGSGTTCYVARKLLRNYIGIDLNPTYYEMARKRIASLGARLEETLRV